jgi:tRNA-specific 2-thiouridylase
MPSTPLTIVALSGGVDSAVAARLLSDAGHDVQCLHMSNWEDDGYCDNAREFQDARRVCLELGLPLHRVSFAPEYREQVFADFLADYGKGRTPNPDVLCNRQIKFGIMTRYARRLGAAQIATGHYARVDTVDGVPCLRKGVDPAKDQSYFLHAVAAENFVDVLMPLGGLFKSEVREIARKAGLAVAEKKDSTGICFIGERPFAEFCSTTCRQPRPVATTWGWSAAGPRLLHARSAPRPPSAAPDRPGERVRPRRTPHATSRSRARPRASKLKSGSLVATLGRRHVGAPEPLRCHAKIRYRQPDQACTVIRRDEARSAGSDSSACRRRDSSSLTTATAAWAARRSKPPRSLRAAGVSSPPRRVSRL